MQMDKYVYPAVFTKEDVGYSINFPDIDGCYTQGETLEEGIEMAEDALALVLYGMEVSGQEIPKPTPISAIGAEGEGFTTLIKADTLEYRKMYNGKSVKKTVTLPEWLNELALKENINFSGVLQEALMKLFNINK